MGKTVRWRSVRAIEDFISFASKVMSTTAELSSATAPGGPKMKSLVLFRHLPHRFAVLSLLLFGVGCQADNSGEMTAATRDEIVQEIAGLLDAYSDAVAT
jgi:hypothetical protein